MFVNIDDYGAVGDGVADDTAAVQAAFDAAVAAGVANLTGPGTYRITTPIELGSRSEDEEDQGNG